MTKRPAFTLVEMSFAMAVGSVLMALALGLVHRTMQTAAKARTHQRVEHTASRLSRQFRQDIHRAQTLVLDPPGPNTSTLRIRLDQQPAIIYRIEKNRVRREQQRTDKQTHQEFFLFPDDHHLQFTELIKPHRIVLTLEQENRRAGTAGQIRLHVAAVVGQFLRPGQAEENAP